jgi:fumarylacetoacetase
VTDGEHRGGSTGFGLEHLPYGVFSPGRGSERRVGVRFGDGVVDVGALLDDDTFRQPTLNAFLAQGPPRWAEVRTRLHEALSDDRASRSLDHTRPIDDVTLHLPFAVGDYVDFYSSIEHATNLGRIMRPDSEPLLPNWRHLPVGYHGRSGTVVVSGTPITRPSGQTKAGDAAAPSFGPTRLLDIELEVGFVTGGSGNPLGEPIPVKQALDHIFGVVLVNDWSARDIQGWEYQPLGPFLGKSFATSISAWVTPLEALRPYFVDGPTQEPPVLPYLRAAEPRNLDLDLSVELTPTGGAHAYPVSRTTFRHLYWSMAQQLAHATANGATIRPGDLFASGTVSGSEPGTMGSFIELTWRGARPLDLADGSTRAFLEDGDTVTLRGSTPDGIIALGDVAGTIEPARY